MVMMDLSINEMKVMREALQTATLTQGGINLADRLDGELKKEGWSLEIIQLPKVKYQRENRYKSVWVNLNK
jgi:hypothetical protein